MPARHRIHQLGNLVTNYSRIDVLTVLMEDFLWCDSS